MLALSKDKLAQAVAIEDHALELERDRLAHDGFFFFVAHGLEQGVLQALLQ